MDGDCIFSTQKDKPILDEGIATLKAWRERIQGLNPPSNDFYDPGIETVLHDWINTLYSYFKKNLSDIRLVIRIIELWNESGRIDKILEIVEDYIAINLKDGCKNGDLSCILRDIYDYLKKAVEIEKKVLAEKINKGKMLIEQMKLPSRLNEKSSK